MSKRCLALPKVASSRAITTTQAILETLNVSTVLHSVGSQPNDLVPLCKYFRIH